MTVTPKIGNKASLLLIFSAFLLLLISIPTSYAIEYQWRDHTLALSARTRLANVHNPSGSHAKAASTLLRLQVNSQWGENLATTIETDYVKLFWESDFTNGVNLNGKPVIPDVGGFDLNQAVLRYQVSNTLMLSLGREVLNWGSQRFIGGNGFWQNEQAFDSAGFTYEFASASTVRYRYIDNANRIQGDKATANGLRPVKFLGDHSHDTHALFMTFNEWDFWRFQTYYFDINIEEAKVLSNQLVGARIDYKNRLGRFKVLANIEFAKQKRKSVGGKAHYIDYHHFMAGLGYRSNQLVFSYERLGQANGVSFVTPLASLHEQNGWADKFLLTPKDGLLDYSLQYIWRKSPIKIEVRYHHFHSDNSGNLLAKESDLDFDIKMGKPHLIRLRLADFKAEDVQYQNEHRVFFMYRYHF